jgi:membrane protease YdiL (CAAX protease family)
MADRKPVAPLAIFLALLVLLTTALASLAIAAEFSGPPVLLMMWSVGCAAIIALRISGRPLAELGWSWGPLKYRLIAFALPIGYSLLAYGAAGLSGLASFPEAGRPDAMVGALHLAFIPGPFAFVTALALLATAGFLQSMTSALGEEIGWRGFLAPRLTALTGFVAGTLITGAIWGAWHMPLILFSHYNGGGDVRFEVASFVVGVIAMSGPMSWLRLRSGSLWPCATFHAAHNLFVQNVFDPLSARGENQITMIGEFGVIFAAAVLLVSLPFWVMGARAQKPAVAATQR